MSRIGRLPIAIPADVKVTVDAANLVTVVGKLGTLTRAVDSSITVTVTATEVLVSRNDEQKLHKAMHGLYRKLIANMVEGVTKGFTKALIINGVGYKVTKTGNKMVLNIGYSHTIEVIEPVGITFELNASTPNEILVKGIDKELVGQTAANIKAFRKPDPYHIYGVRYKDEVIVKKEGKKAGK